jgi:hypothetical protein
MFPKYKFILIFNISLALRVLHWKTDGYFTHVYFAVLYNGKSVWMRVLG